MVWNGIGAVTTGPRKHKHRELFKVTNTHFHLQGASLETVAHLLFSRLGVGSDDETKKSDRSIATLDPLKWISLMHMYVQKYPWGCNLYGR